MPGKDADQEKEIRTAITNLSQKKDVLTKESLRAKAEYDQIKDQLFQDNSAEIVDNPIIPASVIKEFNENAKLLGTIVQKFKFDEILMLMANPTRLLILNLFIGLIRGIGFALGFVGIVFLLAYLSYPLIGTLLLDSAYKMFLVP